MGCFGTKCADNSAHNWRPETLGNIYKGITDQYGYVQINKPRPGDRYRKMFEPISDIDRQVFRRLPQDIIITQPPRLFRSSGRKYKGRVYLDAEYYWEFECESTNPLKPYKDWLPVRLLSYCYINQTLSFITGHPGEPNFWQEKKSIQLTLF